MKIYWKFLPTFKSLKKCSSFSQNLERVRKFDKYAFVGNVPNLINHSRKIKENHIWRFSQVILPFSKYFKVSQKFPRKFVQNLNLSTKSTSKISILLISRQKSQ